MRGGDCKMHSTFLPSRKPSTLTLTLTLSLSHSLSSNSLFFNVKAPPPSQHTPTHPHTHSSTTNASQTKQNQPIIGHNGRPAGPRASARDWGPGCHCVVALSQRQGQHHCGSARDSHCLLCGVTHLAERVSRVVVFCVWVVAWCEKRPAVHPASPLLLLPAHTLNTPPPLHNNTTQLCVTHNNKQQ